MVSVKCIVLAALLVACVSHSGAVDISDLVKWGADVLAGSDGEQRESEGPESEPESASAEAAKGPRRTCHCSGPACMCCLDFNMTYIDLGGPGCVRLRYLGQDAGMAMNVSYGDSLLHSEVVKGASPSGTCIDILSSLAQVCARFSSFTPLEGEGEGEARRGCLRLEPTLLDQVQASYPVGCFRMTPQSMSMEPQAQPSQPSPTDEPSSAANTSAEGVSGSAQEGGSTTVASGTTPELSAESLIAAVSETAEQGIDLLTNWLGITLEEESNSTAAAGSSEDASTTAAPSEETSARSFRRNPNLLH